MHSHNVVLALLRCVSKVLKVGVCYQGSFKYVVQLDLIEYSSCPSVLGKYFITFETQKLM